MLSIVRKPSRCCQATERGSDGGEDQGAEEAIMGQKKTKNNHHVKFWKEPVSRERLFLSARKPSRCCTHGSSYGVVQPENDKAEEYG